jgi:hypothetical protein
VGSGVLPKWAMTVPERIVLFNAPLLFYCIAGYLTALISKVCRKPIEGVLKAIEREGEVPLRRVGTLVALYKGRGVMAKQQHRDFTLNELLISLDRQIALDA